MVAFNIASKHIFSDGTVFQPREQREPPESQKRSSVEEVDEIKVSSWRRSGPFPE